MPEDDVKSSDPKDADKVVTVWDAPLFLKVIVGYAAFGSFAGLITTLINSARLGFDSAELSKSQILLAALIPTAIVIAGVAATRKVQKFLSPNQPLSGLQVVSDMLEMTMVTATVGFIVGLPFWATYFLFHSQANEYRSEAVILRNHADIVAHSEHMAALFDKLANWTLSHFAWYYVPVILLMIVNGIYVAMRDNTGIPSGRIPYIARYLVLTVILGFLGIYTFFVFPRLPQQYGFGAPARVRLLLSSEYPMIPPFQTESVPAGEKEKLRITEPLDLLLKTEKEYVVRYDAKGTKTVITIAAEGVKGVVWNQ
jgi:hypothetical protein